MKKTKKDFEKFILKTIDKYKHILLLNHFTFETKIGCISETAYMEFALNYPYLNCTLAYTEKAFKEWAEGKDVVPFIVHEICHALTDPLYEKACQRYASRTEVEHERERLTDHICNIVLRK